MEQRQQTREEIMGLVVHKLHSKCLSDLAKQIDVSPACLYAIKGKKTKWPRWNTFQKLLPKLGLVLTITEAEFNQPIVGIGE